MIAARSTPQQSTHVLCVLALIIESTRDISKCQRDKQQQYHKCCSESRNHRSHSRSGQRTISLVYGQLLQIPQTYRHFQSLFPVIFTTAPQGSNLLFRSMTAATTKVVLNVYDLMDNTYLHSFGLGAYHSGWCMSVRSDLAELLARQVSKCMVSNTLSAALSAHRQTRRGCLSRRHVWLR
jgi:hypothetical protein